jgi:hypothetical protein
LKYIWFLAKDPLYLYSQNNLKNKEIMTTVNPKSKNTDKSLPNYPSGTPVALLIDGTEVQGEFSHWTKLNEAYIKANGTNWWRKPAKFRVLSTEMMALQQELHNARENGQELTEDEHNQIISAPINLAPVKTFDINKRFEFLGSLTKMVLRQEQAALVVTGDGGLGKTFEVLKQCDAMGLRKLGLPANPEDMDDAEYTPNDIDGDGYDYVVIKGYSTPKGLYQTLYTHQDKLIIFDDCDSVLMDMQAVNILKGALDSYGQRVISWISTVPMEGLPNSFEFFGRVIFISNRKRTQIPQPMISRATSIDVSMTADEKINRMKHILADVRPDLDMDLKTECLDILEKYKHSAKDLNVRTLLKVINIKTSKVVAEAEQTELAEYMVLS